MIRHEVDKKKNQNMISDLSTLVIFKYFLEAFRDSFKVSRFLVFRFLVKTCGKAENDEDKSGNDEAKGVLGRRGVTEGDGTM